MWTTIDRKKNVHGVITNLNKGSLSVSSSCTSQATDLVRCFGWLMFHAICIYHLSYWHLDRFLHLLWSWFINIDDFVTSLTLRATLWFVSIIWYLWFVITFGSIWSQCSDIGDGIWPSQLSTVILLWCGVEVDIEVSSSSPSPNFFLISFIFVLSVYSPSLGCAGARIDTVGCRTPVVPVFWCFEFVLCFWG